MFRVIHVIRSLHKAGAEKLCVDICRALNNRKDVEVLLVSMSPVNQFENLTRGLPLRIINSKVFPSILGKSIIDVEEFVEVVKEFKPDIIHSHLFWTELMSRQILFTNIVYVTHCHDNMAELDSTTPRVLINKTKFIRYFERRWMMKKYLKCNNNFIAISNDTYAYFKRILPKNLKNNLTILHNAVDFDKYKRPSNLDREIQENDTLKLINIGRFAPYKNQHFLLDVFKILQEQCSRVELHFYGEGVCLDAVQKEAERISPHIFIHGNVNDIPSKLWESSLYVHSATYEPYGLVLLEAMAAGLPVITLDGKGNRDIINQGENGFMIYNQDANEFADTILKVWNDKIVYQKLSENAIEFARKHDIEAYTQTLVSYYQNLSNNKKVQSSESDNKAMV